jgi:FolB domain-containing protein
MDRIVIEGLLLRGIVGINPDERTNRQDIRIDVTMWTDTRPAATSDDIADAVNYRTVTKRIIEHVEGGEPMLVERLVAEIADLCLGVDDRIDKVEVAVRKPGALRFAESVGVIIERQRGEDSLS